MQPNPSAERPVRRPLPRTVVALGLVSLLMDTSSEMVHGLVQRGAWIGWLVLRSWAE